MTYDIIVPPLNRTKLIFNSLLLFNSHIDLYLYVIMWPEAFNVSCVP